MSRVLCKVAYDMQAGDAAIAIGKWMNVEQAMMGGSRSEDRFEILQPSETFFEAPHEARNAPGLMAS